MLTLGRSVLVPCTLRLERSFEPLLRLQWKWPPGNRGRAPASLGTGLLLDWVQRKMVAGGCIEEAAEEPMINNGPLALK